MAAGCAVALDHAVGLDIERLDRSFRVSPLRLAKHNFSAGEIGYLEGEGVPMCRGSMQQTQTAVHMLHPCSILHCVWSLKLIS